MSSTEEVGRVETPEERDHRFATLMEAEVLAGYRRATYLGIPLVMGFGILDLASLDRRTIGLFFVLRIGLSIALVAFLALAKRGRKWIVPASMMGTYVAGTTIGLMSAYLGHATFYYAGMNVVILAIGLLVPMAPWSMFSASLMVYLSFAAMTVILDPLPLTEWNWGLFISNSVFVLTTVIVVTVGAYVNRLLRRMAFDATAEQERANAGLRRANEEIQNNYAELADKQHELEEAYRFKSQFLDNMSHELRTPLTCIMTPLEGLLDDEPAGEQREIFEDMQQASTQLYDLINDLLDYSRYGAREVPLRRAPIDLGRLIDDNVRAWMPTARQRRTELSWSRPVEPLVAMVDGRELGKVIRNLLSNAIKFTPTGGSIEVDLSRVGDEILLQVIDSGVGMDEEVLAKIFRPFFQVDGSSTRSVAGTGLGLALVKTIVERHTGTISATSTPGEGTTMTIAIPFLEVSDAEAVAIALPDGPFALAGLSGRRLTRPPSERPPEEAGGEELQTSPSSAGPSSALPVGPTPGSTTVPASAAEESEVGASPSAAPASVDGRESAEQGGDPSGTAAHIEVLAGGREPDAPSETTTSRARSSTSASASFPIPDGTLLLEEHQKAAGKQRSRVLVVDDQPELLRLISRILGREHDVITAGDGAEGLQKVHDMQPDVVISDVMMPRLNGFELVEALRKDESTRRLPVLLLTARADGSDRVRGLRRGANDYLVKPFLPEELKARVRNLLRMRHYESYLTTINEELESKSGTLEGRLHGLFVDTVRTLVAAIDAKDFYTGGHSERVSHFAVRLAEQMEVARPLVRTIELGALLHDIGKIGIPDRVLNKPGRLTEEEIEVIRQHTIFGGRILEKSPELAELRRFALHHHERWDGAGYPDGLAGEEIPASVRIVSVADCWDAMISDRVYRPGMAPKIAAEKVAKLRGNQFDPEVVEALMAIWSDLDVPPHLRPLRARMAPVEQRSGPRVSECGEVYHVHD